MFRQESSVNRPLENGKHFVRSSDSTSGSALNSCREALLFLFLFIISQAPSGRNEINQAPVGRVGGPSPIYRPCFDKWYLTTFFLSFSRFIALLFLLYLESLSLAETFAVC